VSQAEPLSQFSVQRSGHPLVISSPGKEAIPPHPSEQVITLSQWLGVPSWDTLSCDIQVNGYANRIWYMHWSSHMEVQDRNFIPRREQDKLYQQDGSFIQEITITRSEGQVWYFMSKNQPGLQCSDPLKNSPGSHSLLVSDSVGITSSCLLLAFPLSISLASSHLHCLCLSVSISNSTVLDYSQ